MDVLYLFVNIFEEIGDVKKVVEVVVVGVEGIKGMKVSFGRIVYIGGFGFEEVFDLGVWGLVSFF